MIKIPAKFTLASLIVATCVLATNAIAAPAVNLAQTTIETPAGGYIIGNPTAKNHVIEYASYTCSHCAAFEADEAPKLKTSYVDTGRVRFEIRTLVRDPIDLTLAVLARCGGKERFFGNHAFLMANQKVILEKENQISAATAAKFKDFHVSEFMIAAYNDMGLASIMAPRGITNAQARKCLSDKTAVQKILKIGKEARTQYSIQGTPAFIINGKYTEIRPDTAAISALFIK